MTISEFLHARIAEDEAAVDRGRRHNASTTYANDDYGCLLVDPARVLAECEAKRRIIEDVGSGINDGGAEGWAADMALTILATVYSDHPDFNPAWRYS